MKTAAQLRRIIGCMFLVIAVSLTMVADMGLAVTAAEGDSTPGGAAKKIPLTVDFMGTGAAPADTKQALSALEPGNELWLGVGVESNADVPLKLSELGLFTDGMYSLELAFAYDSDYIEPYNVTANMEADWADALQGANLSNAIGDGEGQKPSSAWWDSAHYDMYSVAETSLVVDSETKDLSINNTNGAWKMCTVNLMYTGAAMADARFYGFQADSEKQYLLKLPFTLKSKPESASAQIVKMVLGPETFNIGSGADGCGESSGLWEETVADAADFTNLKNVFDFKGNIYLFSDGTAISNLEVRPVVYGEDDEGNPTEAAGEPLNMYYTDAADGEHGFLEETKEYYVSVDNAVDKVNIRVQSTAGVTINGTPAAEGDDGMLELWVDNLLEIDPATVETDKGFKNTVTVTGAGGEEYTIHIRRLMQPRIEFQPGNSPFGLIERMGLLEDESQRWDAEKIAAAKQAFIDSNDGYGTLKYGEGFVPENAETNVGYTVAAWRSYNKDYDPENPAHERWLDVNYDLDPSAMFVYTGDRYFKEPGVVMYDEMGHSVVSSDMKKKITVELLQPIAGGIPTYGYGKDEGYVETEEMDIEEKTVNDITCFMTTTNQTINGEMLYMIRPDVYFIEYSYLDEQNVEHVLPEKRPVVVLTERGDIHISERCEITSMDLNSYRNSWSLFASFNSLYTFRIADFSHTDRAELNSQDLNTYRNTWSKKECKEFYSTEMFR